VIRVAMVATMKGLNMTMKERAARITELQRLAEGRAPETVLRQLDIALRRARGNRRAQCDAAVYVALADLRAWVQPKVSEA